VEPIFHNYQFTDRVRNQLDWDGHYMFPNLLTQTACQNLTQALVHIESLIPTAVSGHEPNRFAAEYNDYLESLISHPDLLKLARRALGEDIRYDHCVTLNRSANNQGIGWHSHEYSDDDSSLGFIRIFFYVNGFQVNDGGLKVVPGSHLYRDSKIRAKNDEDLEANWMTGNSHPMTGEELKIETLSAPTGTVILMWTHAAHGVTSRKPDSDTRWTVVYAYRNPGRQSRARWISPAYERKTIPGAESLMGLH